MANADVFLTLSKNFFVRNNPISLVFLQIEQGFDFIVNFNSNVKLVKFRFMLYRQQLESIERNLQAGATAPKGSAMDRLY